MYQGTAAFPGKVKLKNSEARFHIRTADNNMEYGISIPYAGIFQDVESQLRQCTANQLSESRPKPIVFAALNAGNGN